MSNLIEVHVQPDLPLLLLVIGLLLRLLAAALVSLLRVGLVLFLLLLARFGVGHLWRDFGKAYSSRGGAAKHKGRHTCFQNQLPIVRFPALPIVAEINQQWLEIVDRTHLVLASGKLVLHKKVYIS